MPKATPSLPAIMSQTAVSLFLLLFSSLPPAPREILQASLLTPLTFGLSHTIPSSVSQKLPPSVCPDLHIPFLALLRPTRNRGRVSLHGERPFHPRRFRFDVFPLGRSVFPFHRCAVLVLLAWRAIRSFEPNCSSSRPRRRPSRLPHGFFPSGVPSPQKTRFSLLLIDCPPAFATGSP